MSQETYIYGGYFFDVELAKRIAKARGRSGTISIVPHRTFPGLACGTPETCDLSTPVIFATFFTPDNADYGVLLIDGSHRVRYALRHKKKVRAAILTPEETYYVLGQWVPKWNPLQFRKFVLSRRFISNQMEDEK